MSHEDTAKFHPVLAMGFQKLLPHMFVISPSPSDAPNSRSGRFLSSRFGFAPTHHDWTWQCLQVQLRVKLRERSVLTLFGVQLHLPKVLMWHRRRRCAPIFLQTCENIFSDYFSLEPMAEILSWTLRLCHYLFDLTLLLSKASCLYLPFISVVQDCCCQKEFWTPLLC